MDPARAPRASDLYHAALDLSAPQRERFLTEACRGNLDLRREVESLLEYERGAAQFLETPPFGELRGDIAAQAAEDLTGQTFASYRVVARLGAGGMGDVYRARDSRLGRDVALKLLPPHLTADPERRLRFAREARLLATLNHPRIGAIYGLEECGGTTALVLELVEGPTLADRLDSGPVPLGQALAIARQVAEALDAAHEKGIVHRDLKPSNIVLQSTDGYEVRAKVLDFGLAKSLSSDEHPNPGEAVDVRAGDTECGRILGTPAYMSPEQARGLPVDRRTDVWAFGCVLFEMLAGRKAFDGNSATDTIARVLEQDPDWDALPAAVPATVSRLVRRCLRKDPATRIRDVRDAFLEVEEGLSAERKIPSDHDGSLKTRVLPRTAAAAAIVGALALGWWMGSTSIPPATRTPGLRLSVDLGPDVSLDTAFNPTIGISPNGERLVFVSGGRLLTRRLHESTVVALTGTEKVSAFFFSPDNSSVAFVADGKLKRTELDGGSVATICEIVGDLVRGGTWGDNDTIMLSTVSGPLSRVPAGGGPLEPITQKPAGEFTERWPDYLPGSKAVIFTSHAYPEWFDGAHVDVLSLVDGRRQTLLTNATFGRFVASADGTGFLTFIRAGAAFAVPFDPVRLEVRGSALPVAEHVAYNPRVGSADLALSRSGTLIFRNEVKAHLKWLGNPALDPLLPDLGNYREPIISEDGSRVAFSMAGDLWVHDLRRGVSTRVTKGVPAAGPVWTPDGRFIVFSTRDNIAWVGSDGGADPQPLLPPARSIVRYPTSIRDFGDHLTLSAMQLQVGSTQGWDLWTVRLTIDRAGMHAAAPQPYLATSHDERQLALSPDGRWAAYNSNESGLQHEVYVRAVPDDGRRWKISDGGGAVPRWSPGRPMLFFQGAARQLMVAPYSTPGGVFLPGAPHVWSPERILDDPLRVYSVRRTDGHVAALLKDPGEERQAAHVVTLSTNILEELRRRAAVQQR